MPSAPIITYYLSAFDPGVPPPSVGRDARIRYKQRGRRLSAFVPWLLPVLSTIKEFYNASTLS